MTDAPRADREFLRACLSLAAKGSIDHLIYISDDPLETGQLRGRPIKKKLIYAVTNEQVALQLRKAKYQTVTIPDYGYGRVEKVKVALIAALTAGVVKEGDTVLCITGIRKDRKDVDTLLRLRIGEEQFEDQVSIDAIGVGAEFNSQVIEVLVKLALAIGQDGFEGNPVGTIIVVGDATAVMEKSRQLILNPFQGISEAERNILDPNIRDAVKNFAVLDGAFIIREDGVVLAAGRYLQSGGEDVKIPLGLGTRHAASAAISLETNAVAIAVSQTSGAVRVFKKGEIVLELHQTYRRV
jgi:diadenylate cyclase